jgi:hypothetical protein
VLQQVEDFHDGSVSANDCLKPVSRYFDRIVAPSQLLTALPRAIAVLTDPALCGPVTLALPQDVQAEAYDYPEAFFAPTLVRIRAPLAEPAELDVAAALLRAAKQPVIVAGGGVLYSDGGAEALRAFAETHRVPVAETQAGKSAPPWDHPRQAGPAGVTGATSANTLAHDADLVLPSARGYRTSPRARTRCFRKRRSSRSTSTRSTRSNGAPPRCRAMPRARSRRCPRGSRAGRAARRGRRKRCAKPRAGELRCRRSSACAKWRNPRCRTTAR